MLKTLIIVFFFFSTSLSLYAQESLSVEESTTPSAVEESTTPSAVEESTTPTAVEESTTPTADEEIAPASPITPVAPIVPDTVAPMQAVKTERRAPQPNIADNSGIILEPYHYEAIDRRDPFAPYVEFTDATTTENLAEVDLAGSQKYDFTDYRLVGILWSVSKPKAMFVDPKKEVHILTKDARIGNKNGYIGDIREGEVVVVEHVDYKGKVRYKTTVLSLER